MSLRLRKPTLYICEKKDADTAQLTSAFVFATQIVQFLIYLYPAFSFILWLYSLVCAGPSRKAKLLFFHAQAQIECNSYVQFQIDAACKIFPICNVKGFR